MSAHDPRLSSLTDEYQSGPGSHVYRQRSRSIFAPHHSPHIGRRAAIGPAEGVIEGGEITEPSFERDGCDGPRSVSWIGQQAMGAGEPLASTKRENVVPSASKSI
jgi:hypothetical protein